MPLRAIVEKVAARLVLRDTQADLARAASPSGGGAATAESVQVIDPAQIAAKQALVKAMLEPMILEQ